jgi:membrane AbrB-like protein
VDRYITSKNLCLALLIGAIGGAIFQALQLPLAWMLGPMTFNMSAALNGLRVAVPLQLRSAMLAVLGVFLGSSFSPETLARATEWPWSLAAIIVFVLLSTGLMALYYRRFGGFDRVTALYSATPGAMAAMILMGAAAGGDERRIALTQALRITLVVVLIPLVVFTVRGSPPPPVQFGEMSGFFQPLELLLLAATVVVGIVLARLARLPAPELAGAMLVSAGFYLGDVVHLTLPEPLLLITLWVLGSSVGARFVGASIREILSVGRHALGATVLVLVLAAFFAAGISTSLEVNFLAALLALSPGGVAEMCLIAVAFNIDPTFVASHHLARMLFLMTLAPLAGRLLRFPTKG